MRGFEIGVLIDSLQAGWTFSAPLEDAKPQLIQALRQARSQQLVRKYLDEMLAAQPIQVNEIELGPVLTAPK